MAKKRRSGGTPGHWKGDAVEKRPGDDAERAADRAEGNEPIRVNAEDERLRQGDPQAQPSSARARPPSDAESEEDEIAEIAEEHQARDAEEQPPRGKL